jgi:hypothetical protein
MVTLGMVSSQGAFKARRLRAATTSALSWRLSDCAVRRVLLFGVGDPQRLPVPERPGLQLERLRHQDLRLLGRPQRFRTAAQCSERIETGSRLQSHRLVALHEYAGRT